MPSYLFSLWCLGFFLFVSADRTGSVVEAEALCPAILPSSLPVVSVSREQNDDQPSKMLCPHSYSNCLVEKCFSNQRVGYEEVTEGGRNCLPVGRTVVEQVLGCGNVRA